MKMDSINGFFTDDGEEINPDLIPIPHLCMSCKKKDWGGMEEILCTMNRLDQKGSDEFICGAYEGFE
jgi:hypothetical protein